MFDDFDVIEFLKRDGPLLAVLGAAAALGLHLLSSFYRAYEGRAQERIALYVVTVLQMWMFLLIFLVYVYWARTIIAGVPLQSALFKFGLISPIEPRDLVFWAASLFVLWVAMAWAFSALQKALKVAPTAARLSLQPKTATEAAMWILLVAPTTGFCEEVFFRGYIVSLVLEMDARWVAVVVSAGLFGLLHLAQGVIGVLAATLMAGTAAIVLIETGSLWPPIVAHAFYNMVAPFLFDDQMKAKSA